MKSFNLIATDKQVAGNTISVLELGEIGRGRTLVSIACPKGIKT